MKVLYGIEPNLCIRNPEALVNFTKDIILPKYFFTQLIHLSNGNFQFATDAATIIVNSLIKYGESDVFIFKTVSGGTVYVTDEATYQMNINNQYENIDTINLLDRYLLSLLKVSDFLEAEVIFIASSPEIIRKCHTLNFEVANLEEFAASGESWLRPEMLVDIQASIYTSTSAPEALPTQEQVPTSELDTFIEEIQWRDIRVAEEDSNIHWIDIMLR